jgi:NitT/TauT family transport system ATP-binding protein
MSAATPPVAGPDAGVRRGHVQIQDVSVRFGTPGQMTEAASGVSLEVKPGEFVSIIGPSGCGKSTLLNIVAGFLRPSEGQALLDGKAINGPGADRGVVFQQYSLFPWMTVRKNVEFGLKMQGVSPIQRETAARSLLGMTGLLSFENHYPDQLSGGMKQRVGIVRALATSPQVLLMDEPFGALDAQTREVMHDLILHIHRTEKTTIVFVTHDVDEAIYLGQRVVLMEPRPGRIHSIYPVPLPARRQQDMKHGVPFRELKAEILSRIRESSGMATDLDLLDQICQTGESV